MFEKDLLQSYDRFKPFVDDIKSDPTGAELVGAGAESSVWKVALGGADYAVKLLSEYSPRGRRRNVQAAVAAKVKAGARGLGISGLEQLRAASVEDGVVVYDFAKGVNLSGITDSTTLKIDAEHLVRLKNTIMCATQAGIEFDGWNEEGGNAFFCPQKGFTLIDYWAAENLTYSANRLYAIRSLGSVGLRLADKI